MGRTHTPFGSAASGVTDGNEDRNTDRNQACSDEDRKQRVAGHQFPNLAGQVDNRVHCGHNGRHATRDNSLSLKTFLLSFKFWLRGLESNQALQVQILICYLCTTPQYIVEEIALFENAHSKEGFRGTSAHSRISGRRLCYRDSWSKSVVWISSSSSAHLWRSM